MCVWVRVHLRMYVWAGSLAHSMVLHRWVQAWVGDYLRFLCTVCQTGALLETVVRVGLCLRMTGSVEGGGRETETG